jgi:hypothetical protein
MQAPSRVVAAAANQGPSRSRFAEAEADGVAEERRMQSSWPDTSKSVFVAVRGPASQMLDTSWMSR